MDGVAIDGRGVPNDGGAPFAPYHRWDRNFYLAFVGLIWLVMISGFGWDIVQRAGRKALHYPLIVQAHAVVFVGWLALLTAQLFLIRRGERELHKRLGWRQRVEFRRKLTRHPYGVLTRGGSERRSGVGRPNEGPSEVTIITRKESMPGEIQHLHKLAIRKWPHFLNEKHLRLLLRNILWEILPKMRRAALVDGPSIVLHCTRAAQPSRPPAMKAVLIRFAACGI